MCPLFLARTLTTHTTNESGISTRTQIIRSLRSPGLNNLENLICSRHRHANCHHHQSFKSHTSLGTVLGHLWKELQEYGSAFQKLPCCIKHTDISQSVGYRHQAGTSQINTWWGKGILEGKSKRIWELRAEQLEKHFQTR